MFSIIALSLSECVKQALFAQILTISFSSVRVRGERRQECSSSTYITEYVDKRVVGAVRHCQPVTAEKDDVYVGIPEHNMSSYLYLSTTK